MSHVSKIQILENKQLYHVAIVALFPIPNVTTLLISEFIILYITRLMTKINELKTTHAV